MLGRPPRCVLLVCSSQGSDWIHCTIATHVPCPYVDNVCCCYSHSSHAQPPAVYTKSRSNGSQLPTRLIRTGSATHPLCVNDLIHLAQDGGHKGSWGARPAGRDNTQVIAMHVLPSWSLLCIPSLQLPCHTLLCLIPHAQAHTCWECYVPSSMQVECFSLVCIVAHYAMLQDSRTCCRPGCLH
jgi:hypothetical protein